MSLKREPHWTQASKARLTNVFRHYNSNLNLNSQPSKTPNWCTRSPCLWNRGLLCTTIWLLKYRGCVQTLSLSGFEPVTLKRKHRFLTVRPLSVQTIYDPPGVEFKTTISYWSLVLIPMDITCKILSCQRQISQWLLVWTYLHNFLSFKISNAIDILNILG